MRFIDARILVFAKAPVPGRSKSRLAPALGAQGAAELHARLVRHTLTTATQAALCPVELWCGDHPEHPFFRACLKAFPVILKQQQGANLGNRMANAFDKTLKEASPVLLIGSDCPALTAADLETALDTLADGNDCVLKPAEDGGYVLIGLSTFSDAIFAGVHWGGTEVMNDTRARLASLEWRWHELPTTWDLDRPDDLDRLKKVEALASDPAVAGPVFCFD